MQILLYALSFFIFFGTLLPLLKHEHWTVRFFDFPYVQLTSINLVLIISWLIIVDEFSTLNYVVISLLILSLVYRLWIIFPYTRLASFKVPHLGKTGNYPSLKIISANVLMYNNDYQGLLDIVSTEEPDLVLLIEADQKWENAVHNDFKNIFPYRLLEPLDNTYGLLLYSKLQLSDTQIRYLIEEDVPSFHAIIHLGNDEKVRFFGVHPKPPSPTENKTSIPRDAELIMIGREARKSKLPVIIAGDLNDVAWSHTTRLFIRTSELLDPRMGRGFFNTYHANYPFLRWPLDHLFLSADFQVVAIKRLDNFHSDHFPIYMEIELKPSRLAKENIEVADTDDKIETRDKVAKVNMDK